MFVPYGKNQTFVREIFIKVVYQHQKDSKNTSYSSVSVFQFVTESKRTREVRSAQVAIGK